MTTFNAFNLSDSDKNAIDFYEENLNFVKGFGLTNLEREERRMFKKGKTLVEQLAAATKAVLNPRNAEATRWTAEEYDAIARAYYTHGANEKACLAEFRVYSERHSDYAIRLSVNSCKFLDTSVKDAKGLHDYANGLLLALQALDATRFQGRR